jgi:hypothetical protein
VESYKQQQKLFPTINLRACSEGMSVKWDNIFHMKPLSHLTGKDILADFDL